MRRLRQSAIAVLLCVGAWPLVARADDTPTPIHHQLQVVMQPDQQQIAVRDTINIPADLVGDQETVLKLLLHANLQPSVNDAGVTLSISPQKPFPGGVPTEILTVTLPRGLLRFTLDYGGRIHHPLETGGEEYARSFNETPGTIGSEGVYLSAATSWFPRLADRLVTFQLEVDLPNGWRAVSQGQRASRSQDETTTRVEWVEWLPQDDIYLVAARFHEYTRAAGNVTAMAFLREPDEGLANRYLEATVQYVEMYRRLIGPYPYTKFALVENFWETGYGMPSFTLLGPKVIRLPFILHSSYPHEILHNWWGNGVFVDYEGGNWCEGLTAYLADHLIKEQRGSALAYRRSTLQAYGDYAAEKRDFPLREFRSRHSSATQAVGYGKCLMLFHMLRRQLGDKVFISGLQRLYSTNRGRRASFDHVVEAFSKAARSDLRDQLSPWINDTGAPQLRIASVQSTVNAVSGWELRAIIEQVQEGDAYHLSVPLAVDLEGQEQAYETTVTMHGKTAEAILKLRSRPTRVRLDPQFDLFRRLDHREIPPALSSLLGAEKVLIVLPAKAPANLLAAFESLATAWSHSAAGKLEIRRDDEVEALPDDRSIWLLGWDNRFASVVVDAAAAEGITTGDRSIGIGAADPTGPAHSIVLTSRHPADPQLAVALVATDNAAAVPGLTRKLPHYGKYGYLVFQGDEPTNVDKGHWQTRASPNVKELVPGAAVARLGSRAALADLPPVFDAQRMMDDVRVLASPAMGGRGFGSPGLDAAAVHIATQLKAAGLQPGGDEAGYFQVWTDRGGEPEADARLRNVVAVLPGSRTDWAGQSVVLGAHYDHLGRGWPDVRQGHEGKVHPGADDNASGVAVLLELARIWSRGWRPERTVVLAFFAGEEAGLRGSRHYLSAIEDRFPAARCLAMVNLDSVGRLADRKLQVLGTGTAREWPHVFRGITWVTGVATAMVSKDPGASDQVTFHQAGIPAVQLFSGPHEDYHRPGDVAEKIDAAGLVKVATVVKEAMEFLAAQPEPLASQLTGATAPSPPRRPGSGGRRVSLGTIPDFAFSGPGVRLEGVVTGSPAEAAGLRAGDTILAVNEVDVADLRGYSQVLKALEPGQKVAVRFRRDGAEQSLTLTAAPR